MNGHAPPNAEGRMMDQIDTDEGIGLRPQRGREDDAQQPAQDPIATIALAQGEEFVGGGNRPISLSDPELVWYVVEGAVDVFVAEYSEEESASNFRQLLRAGPGRLIFGVGSDDTLSSSVYIGKGLPDTHLRRVPRSAFTAPEAAELLTAQVDAWITDVAATIAREVVPRPRPERFLTAGEEVDSVSERILSTRQGVVWAHCPNGGAFLDTGEPTGDGPGFIPMSVHSWITLFSPSPVKATSSRGLEARGLLFDALAEFHRLALSVDEMNQRLMLVDMANLQRAQVQHRRQSEERARDSLFGVLDTRRPLAADEGSALLSALKLVGDHEGIQFRVPPRWREGEDGNLDLAEIQRVSGVRARQIKLAPDDRWWLGDSGALLAFRRESGAPVALLPGLSGRYRMIDPATGGSERVDARLARSLEAEGRFFYRSLPPEEPVRVVPLLRFACRGLGRELARFILAGMVVGLLMLAPSILLGAVVDSVIPSGSGGRLLEVALALVLLAFLTALLQVLQGTALMRLEALASARVGAAVWDRMLGLPQRFFRRFASGDLAMRAMALQGLRDQVSGVVASAILSVIFLLPTFILLFLYDNRIGWLGLALGTLSLGVTSVIGILQLPIIRRLLETTRKLAGDVLQLLNGVGKLRSTGSEGIGFAEWAKGYRDQKRTEMRLGMLGEHLGAFLAAAPLLAVAAVFAVALGAGGTLATGDFLTIYAAFMVFYMAVARLGGSFSAIASILPAYEQATPILEAVPGAATEGEPPPDLSGDVLIDHVSFRYADDGPPVVDDVSIRARAGEFVAIVGESGAGKSTLFRLALGLESPLSGAVYYDGRDLARLNRRAVRSQISMVVQDASMRPGTVLENIVGLATDLTEQDAWRAAALAAIDQDIAAMPMGMHTVAGSGTFAGGQIQRIMLAAALVRDPSILFLDEATNWLDNNSQAQVMQSVADLAITRFVSAHRLSTIRRADSIYVLQGGRVVQTGTFDELIEAEGPFRNLALRQMA